MVKIDKVKCTYSIIPVFTNLTFSKYNNFSEELGNSLFLRKSNPWSVILWRHLQGKNYFHLLTFARFLSLCGCEFIDHLNNFPLSSNTYCMHDKMYCARSLSKIWMISIKNLMSIVFFVSLTWLPQRGVHYTVKYKPWNTNILFIS